MFFVAIFIVIFTHTMISSFDTTIAPRQTVTAYSLVMNNEAKLCCQGNYDSATCFPDTYALELHNARVYEDGHIITHNNFLLEDTIIKYPAKPLSEYHMLKRNALPKAIPIKGRVVVLASPGAQCYFHWMFQILPRLKIIQDLGLNYDALYIEPFNCAFQLETIAKIGLDNKRVIFGKSDTQIIAETLIVPSIIIKDPNFAYPSWIVNFLRSTFIDESFLKKYNTYKRIYISRSKAYMRKIINEDEVESLLRTLGFSTIYLEDLSLFEQAALIASADIIVGPHGSGFSNLIFAHPKAHCIEIFSEEGINKLFFNLARAVDLNHHTLICSDEGLSSQDKTKEGIMVDVLKLASLLEEIIMLSSTGSAALSAKQLPIN